MLRPIVASLLATLLAQPLHADSPGLLAKGRQQYTDGMLSEAVLALDEVIQAERAASKPDTNVLVQAFTYKGAALVGLGQETSAKASFKEALVVDPNLRLSKAEFPDRVIRVFEAARTGKQKSVLQRPSGNAKKAGIGATGIALIAAGVAAAGAGVAVATGGGGSTPTTLGPTIANAQGYQFVFLGSSPSPGSTITVPTSNALPLTLQIAVTPPVGVTVREYSVSLFKDRFNCAFGGNQPATFAGGQATTITVTSLIVRPDEPNCGLPLTTNRVTISVLSNTVNALEGFDNVTYTFVR
jgi:hypothetical protein